MSSRTKKGLIAAGVVAVLGVGGAAVAVGTDEAGDDDATQKSITGSALQKASDAALEHTGGGRSTETEVGDEESYYEVEVTTDEGQHGRAARQELQRREQRGRLRRRRGRGLGVRIGGVIEVDAPNAELRQAADAAVSAAGLDGHLAIELVDEDRIRELNRDYRGKDEPTDVLSFPVDEASARRRGRASSAT